METSDLVKSLRWGGEVGEYPSFQGDRDKVGIWKEVEARGFFWVVAASKTLIDALSFPGCSKKKVEQMERREEFHLGRRQQRRCGEFFGVSTFRGE